jgi:hypothetical protein
MLVSLLLTVKSGGREAPNLERTLEAQKRLISERPLYAEGHNDLGNLLVLAGLFEEAEFAYGRAQELDPANTAAGFNLGLLFQQSGRSKEALRAFKAVMGIDPGHAWATYQAGAVLHEGGKRKEALEHYARAFALDSSLTFAKTNPHYIDNDLATEALLMSEKYTTETSTRMPRLYGEPGRIVDLMLQIEEEESEENAAGNEREPGKAPEQKQRRHPRPVERSGEVGQPVRQQRFEAHGEDEEEKSGPGRSESVQAVGGTVVGSANSRRKGKNSREKARGNARQGAVGGGGRGATVNNDRKRGGAAGSGQLQRQTPRRSRYRPATTSTGRLELELLPEEKEPERVTR